MWKVSNSHLLKTSIFTLQPIHHDVTIRKNHTLVIAFIWIRNMLYLGLICFYGLLLFNQYKILILYSEILILLKQFEDTYVKNMNVELCHIVNPTFPTILKYTSHTKIQNIFFTISTFSCLSSLESNHVMFNKIVFLIWWWWFWHFRVCHH